MAKARIVLKSKIYKDGTQPICLIIRDGKEHVKVLHNVESKYWDKKNKEVRRTHRLWYDINKKISAELLAAQKYLMECDVKMVKVNAASFLSSKECFTLYDAIMQKSLEHRNKDGYGTARRLKALANKIHDFDKDIEVDRVDEGWVIRFDKYLSEKLGNNPNTRHKGHSEIKKICKSAYDNFRVKKSESLPKVSSKEDIDLLWDAQLSGKRAVCRDLYLFSYYTRGMRVHDCLIMKDSNFDNGRIKYFSQKSEFKKYYDVKVYDRCIEIINRNKGKSELGYIFDLLRIKHQKKNENFLKEIDRRNSFIRNQLHIICSKLEIPKVSMHVARYSWAVHKYKSGVALGTLQKALGHSDPQTTVRYLRHVINAQELDDALGED